jgi:hypothetical protein
MREINIFSPLSMEKSKKRALRLLGDVPLAPSRHH